MTSNIALLNQEKLKLKLVFLEIVTKYDVGGPNIESFFILKTKVLINDFY